jgi:hypothetical protein
MVEVVEMVAIGARVEIVEIATMVAKVAIAA